MKLVTIESIEPVVAYLVETISKHLGKGERVLWLVPGGSAITVAAEASKQLAQRTDLHNLTVSLTDERYGEVDHPNENWQQLLNTGFVLPGARLYRVLSNESREYTTVKYGAFLFEALGSHHYHIGLFGIGTDGHTAGIKPQSSAIVENAMAADFEYSDYERITMTTHAISKLDEAVVFAVGQEKFPVVSQLLHENVAVEQQPAQALKTAGKCTIFSDYTEK